MTREKTIKELQNIIGHLHGKPSEVSAHNIAEQIGYVAGQVGLAWEMGVDAEDWQEGSEREKQ